MTDLINGLAVIGALNVATLAAFAAWVLADLLKGRRAGRPATQLLSSVDSTRPLDADEVG